MKAVGVVLYLLTNIGLGFYYVLDLFDLFFLRFNYDGFRYFIPIVLADIGFILSLVILFITSGLTKKLLVLVFWVIIHNLTIGAGVDNIPIIGVFSVLMSLVCLKLVSYSMVSRKFVNGG